MKSNKLIYILFILELILSCDATVNDNAFKSYNEGVKLSLESIVQQEKGNLDKASQLNKLSIEKYKETFNYDSSHSSVRSALGHSLYIDRQFNESKIWFEKSLTVNGEDAWAYRELGLSKINLGEIKPGQLDIEKSFKLDTTNEFKKSTLNELFEIGNLANQYGANLIKQGDLIKGKDYKIFSIGILMITFEYDTSNKLVAKRISELAKKFGDKETAIKYQKLAK